MIKIKTGNFFIAFSIALQPKISGRKKIEPKIELIKSRLNNDFSNIFNKFAIFIITSSSHRVQSSKKTGLNYFIRTNSIKKAIYLELAESMMMEESKYLQNRDWKFIRNSL